MTPNPSRTRTLALALLAFAAGAAHADTGNLYSVTSKVEIVGLPFQMPAQTAEVCGPKDTTSERMVPHDENCRVEDFRVVGDTASFRMVCTGPNAMTATGEFQRLANDGYRGRMQAKIDMNGQSMDMTMTFEGRKLRECDYEPPSLPAAAAAKAKA